MKRAEFIEAYNKLTELQKEDYKAMGMGGNSSLLLFTIHDGYEILATRLTCY
jgi:hypothetical protein